MKRSVPRVSLLIAPMFLLLFGPPTLGASAGVRDDAHFFSSSAISQADQVISQINARHHRDVLIETVPSVPQDMAQQEQSLGRKAFFTQWADQRALQEGVTGVYVLICKDPPHLQAAVGNATAQRMFTTADRDELGRRMLAPFKAQDYDQGLLDGVRFIQQQMDAHVPSGGGGMTQYNGGSAAPIGPYGSSPVHTNPPRGDMSWGFGSIACLIVAVILGIILIRGVMGRSGGSYGAPGGYYPPGGGAYPPGGGYAPPGYGGGYAGGGGSGFGRGFLGGLLGGALGGYAAERWTGQNQQQGGGYMPQGPVGGGGGAPDYNPGPDTSFSSSGGDFGGSDSSGGGGGDFGGGGGGGDFGGGGGGGDSGGGGGGGGDF